MIIDILIGMFLLTASVATAVIAYDIVKTDRESTEIDARLEELDREFIAWLKAQREKSDE